ncbi:MAG: glycosyltransferase, partial [Legionellales bacterium]|nr:glycosyltransferase [Legionellales bacterium]
MASSSQNTSLPLLSICIPVLNEEANLATLYQRLDQLSIHMQTQCRFEFVFTDNHSSDSTWDQLITLSQQDSRVRAIRFSKNVGFQRSILANYLHARGDAVIQVDADLQDPPELIERFFKLWQQGYCVGYGIRRKRQERLVLRMVR